MKHSNLMNLYREMIVEYGENPHNYGKMSNPSVSSELHNPSCGDFLNLELKIKDKAIKDVKFMGEGCIISQASASILTDLIKNKNLTEAKELKELFSKMITDPNFKNISALGEAEILQGVRKFPARIKCATLAWNALENALKNLEEDNG